MRSRRAINGTPGWVVWCPDWTYAPTPSLLQAEADFTLAQGNGCPHRHRIRPVLIAKDGVRFRYRDGVTAR